MSVYSSTVDDTATTFFTAAANVKGVVTGIKIYNADTGLLVFTIQDVFTPDATIGTPAPAEETKQMLKVSIASTLTGDIPETELSDWKFLGAARVLTDTAPAANDPTVTLIYHFE